MTFFINPTTTRVLWESIIILTDNFIITKRESLFKAVTVLSEGLKWEVSLRMNLSIKLLCSSLYIFGMSFVTFFPIIPTLSYPKIYLILLLEFITIPKLFPIESRVNMLISYDWYSYPPAERIFLDLTYKIVCNFYFVFIVYLMSTPISIRKVRYRLVA